MQIQMPAISIGWVLALVALVLAVVFAAVGQLDMKVAVLVVLLALARLIP